MLRPTLRSSLKANELMNAYRPRLLLRASRQSALWLAAIIVAASAMLSGASAGAAPTEALRGPELVLKEFLQALYSRDAKAAYGLLSRADQDVKTLKQYAAETGAFSGSALSLARALAGGITYKDVQVKTSGTRATVTFDAVLPNANDPAVDELVLGFNRRKLSDLSEHEFLKLERSVRKKARAGELPALRSKGETWSLVLEAGHWRVHRNWAEAIEVNFTAMTFNHLGWEFTPVRDHVMAKHGETVRMAYRVRNVGGKTSTGKARHIIGPGKHAQHLEIISCFCFLEQTLDPGEVAELPLVFRVDYDTPDAIKKFSVAYEFYPVDAFPSAATQNGEGS